MVDTAAAVAAAAVDGSSAAEVDTAAVDTAVVAADGSLVVEVVDSVAAAVDGN